MRFRRVVLLVVTLAVACGSAVLGQETAEKKLPQYVGLTKCKMCHMLKARGDQFGIWKKAKHSQAFALLGTDEAKAMAAKAGVTGDPQKSEKCLKCHTTAFGVPKERGSSKLKPADGIQCETCHGAGGDYVKGTKHPEDEAARKAAGLTTKTPKEVCLGCHNEESPTWDPERYTTEDGRKVGFDYATLVKLIRHPTPKPEGEQTQ
jgi:hypothetical protein